MAYNDPTLGEQVVSASEFERLRGLQRDKGVAVATEPPAEAGDPGVLALWVDFAAGLMALGATRIGTCRPAEVNDELPDWVLPTIAA